MGIRTTDLVDPEIGMHLSLPFSTGLASQEYLVAEEGVIRAHEEGCSHWYIDLSLPSDHTHQWTAVRTRALISMAKNLGVRPIVHGNFRAPLATEIPEIRSGVLDYMGREIDLAGDLGAPLIVHGGSLVDPRPTESARWSALQRFIDFMEQLCQTAESVGVEIWVENLSHYPRYRPFTYVFTRYADYVALRERLPEIGLIFDVGHANVNQKYPLQIFRDFGRSIKAVSVSDNDGRSDAHLGLGRGSVPVGEFVALLGETEWTGVVAFETRGTPVEDGVRDLRHIWDQLGLADPA
ncbi:sugar phosphate isomerase/epimerase family protein [Streptosporangium sp. NBC_01469]|uniref:sugar phosphate isomerase/epimerase family protein n=1 Tax=Streptosporangium sp. NBC_01469 TaxID=2903898 RepID=UPI002E2C83BA|nr:sugar phosphate isomerase/epimerase family protein [Streptosporangium sp. NBC_01469]